MKITERIDRITNIEDAQRTTTPPCPRAVKIELTGKCNFNCAFCARGKRLRNQEHMSQRLYARLMLEMRDAGVTEAGLFFLGESLMVPWLDDAVAFAKNWAEYPYVFLTTNASLATPEKVQSLMEAGLDSLKFSLNYADAEQFAAIAQVKPSIWPTMLANIAAAKTVRDQVEARTGHRCGLFASYIQYDGAQGERMKVVLDDLRPYLDEVYALPLYSQADLVGADEAERGWAITAGNQGRLGAMREPIPCWSVFTEARITWDGKLAACCFDHRGDFEMADLTKVGFMEGWHSDKFQALRKAHLAGDVTGTACENCVAYGG